MEGSVMGEELTDWLTQLRVLAAMCEGYATSVGRHDEPCARSMRFVASRLDQVTEQLHGDDDDREWHL